MDSNSGKAQVAGGSQSTNGQAQDLSQDQILQNLEASHRQAHAAPNPVHNPLMTRVNQNSAELAQLAAVGVQGIQAPSVIGDYVGLSNGSNARPQQVQDMNDTLRDIRLGVDDDDEANELDDDEDDVTMDFTPVGSSANGASSSSTGPVSMDLMAVASAVDPKGLMAMTGQDSWDSANVPIADQNDDDDDVAEEFDQDLYEEDEDELDPNDPAMQELGFALQPKSKRMKKKERRTQQDIILDPEVQNLLGRANLAYVTKDFNEAVELYQQVIVKDPKIPQAWLNMGEIQEDLGNKDKAIQLKLVAAHLRPKNSKLWKDLGRSSKNLEFNQQALYCFTKAYAADRTDMDALWDRSWMQAVMGQPEKAIRGYLSLLKTRPHYMPALEEIVKLYSSQSQDNKKYQENMHRALEMYEAAYLHYSSMPDQYANSDDPFAAPTKEDQPFSYSALNILSDLYIMFEEYEKPLQIIKTWSRRLQRRSHQTYWDEYTDDREFETDDFDEELQSSLGDRRTRGLPIDLRVKIGTCRLMFEEVKEAKVQFRYLWKCSVEDFPDLYENIAELYVQKQMWKDGYNVIRAMLQFDELDTPKTWIMAGECLRNMNRTSDAKHYLEQAHQADPTNLSVNLLLAEVYEELGNFPQALTLANYVRKVNEEKMAETERKRREIKKLRDAKLGRDTSEYTAAPPTVPMDPDYPGYRQLAPRGLDPMQIAAREAFERIRRSGLGTGGYGNEDRDRDMRLLKAMREQERAERVKAQKSTPTDLEVAELFNRLDVIFVRIDEVERSRVWESKREAVAMTRHDRTQFIHAARELIDIFRSNRAFFVRDRSKPYMGGETRAWRYRRDQNNADSGLSDHVKDMTERLGRAMGIEEPSAPAPTRELAENNIPKLQPPTSYRGVPFEAWYLVVIRQAVFLTYEDRYSEAAELLMKMHNANVFFCVPRRRSGIFLVLLACAIWSGDYGGTIRAARWIAHFGGYRPLAIKIFTSVFTFGSRGDPRFFMWAQSTTSKSIKRQMELMRAALGKRMMLATRRRNPLLVRKPKRKAAKRGPRRQLESMAPTLKASVKRFKPDVNVDLSTSVEYRAVLEPLNLENAISGRKRWQKRPAQEEEDQVSASTSALNETLAAAGSSILSSTSASSSQDREHPVPGNDGEIEITSGEDDEEEDAAGTGDDAYDDDDGDDDQGDDDEDEDERYRTDYERDKIVDADDDDIDWEDDVDETYPGGRPSAFGVRRPSPRPAGHLGPDMPSSVQDGTNTPAKVSTRSSMVRDRYKLDHPDVIQGEFGEERTRVEEKGRTPFTEPVFPKFPISLAMFAGHIFSMSRSHPVAAEHYLECLEYAPQNPIIHLYASLQYLHTAMQRTTTNRQLYLVRGLTLLQNYYHLRRAGYGTVAHAQLANEMKTKGKSIVPPPSVPPLKKHQSWMEQANQASEEALKATSTSLSSTIGEREKTTVAFCQQEAEYNFARALHQMGQHTLALVHYRRVLELPSWRQVEREREAAEKVRRQEDEDDDQESKEDRRTRRALERAAALDLKFLKANERREAQARRAAERLAAGLDPRAGEEEDEVEEDEEEEVDDDGSSGEDDDDKETEGPDGQSKEPTAIQTPKRPPIQVQGAMDDDPTDLKREAAYNMARIYMLSGAAAQAQLVMHKYCTF
ncbi:transcription factor TFIIIC subunit tfc4 [Gryganskiella cystojenkinii]|nr:transcription factor TFIIIC subunit tfc4 [Gryganskiella cystojenkinii]